MPELEFVVQWPDGSRQSCYSPSRAIREHLEEGTPYTLSEFLDRARAGLQGAAERVRQVHGFLCSRALDELSELERRAGSFTDTEATVEVLSIRTL
jgi:uncharacterized repeat protein (TIGR04042 family)